VIVLGPALNWLVARVGTQPLRVAGGVAALGAGSYLYGAVEVARESGSALLPALATTVGAHPAYGLLVAAGVLALVRPG